MFGVCLVLLYDFLLTDVAGGSWLKEAGSLLKEAWLREAGSWLKEAWLREARSWLKNLGTCYRILLPCTISP